MMVTMALTVLKLISILHCAVYYTACTTHSKPFNL